MQLTKPTYRRLLRPGISGRIDHIIVFLCFLVFKPLAKNNQAAIFYSKMTNSGSTH
jgi:hypothetical protein